MVQWLKREPSVPMQSFSLKHLVKRRCVVLKKCLSSFFVQALALLVLTLALPTFLRSGADRRSRSAR